MITDKVGGSSAKPEVSKQSKEKRLKHKVSGYKSQSKRRSIAGCRLLLRTLHLDSITKTQRILCCKKLTSEDLSSWKIILLLHLKPVGGKFILGCNFDVKNLPIKLPGFYEECLKDFSRSSAENKVSLDNINAVDISKIILWNNC